MGTEMAKNGKQINQKYKSKKYISWEIPMNFKKVPKNSGKFFTGPGIAKNRKYVPLVFDGIFLQPRKFQ